MKILHTSDTHLRFDAPERIDALRNILTIGTQEGIDLLVISGDMFDDHEAAERLRPQLREILSNNPFKILVSLEIMTNLHLRGT